MPESDEQVRERHLRWLNRNVKTLTGAGSRAYHEFGRGYYITSVTSGSTDLRLEYVPGTEHLPDDETSRYLARMVNEYDPATQIVVVIRELDESLHAYRWGFVAPS
jgi:hypothetical protein